MAAKKDPRVDVYIEAAAEKVQPLLRALRKTVHARWPNVTETIKWNVPFFLSGDKLLGGLGAFKEHAAIGFWKGKYHRVEKLADIPPASLFKKMYALATADEPKKKTTARKKK